MTEERKHAILFEATILAARKLNDRESTPWSIGCAIDDAISKAEQILERFTRNGQRQVIFVPNE